MKPSSSPNPNRFQTTRWSLVLSAREQGPDAEVALEELCRRYWPALRSFAVRMGCTSHDADDMAQGFFIQVVEKDLFARADPERGKLRTFLATAFRRYLQDQWSKAGARKRGGGLEILSFDESRDSQGNEPRNALDQEWAARVMELSLERLQERYRQDGRLELLQSLRPYLTGELPEGGYAALADEQRMSSGAAKVALHRARKRFGEALRYEVAETLGPDEEVESELRHLLMAVS